MRVLRCDPPRARAEGPAGFTAIEELRAASDIITLHVPLTREGADATLGMVDEDWLNTCKRGAILINTSRGEVLSETALAAALSSARLGGAVLDVWRNEPAPDPSLIARVDLATPHVAGHSLEWRHRAAAMIRDALAAWAGRPAARADSLGARSRRPGEAAEPRCPGDIAVAPGGSWWSAVSAVTLSACDIASVDRALRRLPPGPEGEGRFDELRSAFARRREFPAYRAAGARADSRVGRGLSILGFGMPEPPDAAVR